MTTLPPTLPPQHQKARPRALSALSHASNRSHHSSPSKDNKPELIESTKEMTKLVDTKANPSKALNEAQPAAVALQESNLDDMRAMHWKDVEGNVITDPDRSNPSRSRMERPLDTIRSFNAAADGTANRRSSYQTRRPPQLGQESGNGNRRASYYGNQNSMYSAGGRPRPGQGGYYRQSSYGYRPESYVDDGSQLAGRPMRYPNAPYYAHGESPSSIHSHHHSYETMTSGSEDFARSTNPSSQNSSFDHLQQINGRKHEDGTHPSQYDQTHMNATGMRPPMQNGAAPPVNEPRRPIKLTTAESGPPPTLAEVQPKQSVKRQSWIRRKFSRRDS